VNVTDERLLRKAYKQLSTLRAALAAHQAKHAADSAIEPAARAA
jgi:hypothetical protein